jgi:hypothetical protein
LIDVCVVDVLSDLFARPIGKRRPELPVAFREERPGQMRKRRH